LAHQRPELGLDPDLIVTGSSVRMETASTDEASVLQCYQMMNAADRKRYLQIGLLWSGTLELQLPASRPGKK